MSELAKTSKKSAVGLKNKVVALTKRFANSNGFKFVSPLSVKRKQKVANLDALVVGYFGILGVKVLDFDNGTVYGDIADKQWLWVDKKEKRTYFPNPMIEAAADVRILRDALFEKKLQQTPIEIVCVFSSKKVQIVLPVSTGHYTLKTFKPLLRKEKYKNDTGLDLDKVFDAVQKSDTNF